MKFKSKNSICFSKKGNAGRFDNPYVRTLGGTVDTADANNKRLTVPFALQYDKGGTEMTLEKNTITFDSQYIPTLIEDENGNDVEILSFLQTGVQYDKEKIVDWGKPDFNRAINYFQLDSIWNDLLFTEVNEPLPLRQIALDWLYNAEYSVKIEGCKLGEYFELEEE